jgi:SET domain
MEADWKEFHQFVCGDVAAPKDCFSNYLILKMLFKMLAVFNGNVDEMKEFLRANKEPRTIFDFDFNDENDPMYQKNLMLASLSLTSPVSDNSMVAMNCQKLIQHNRKLKEMWKSPSNRSFLDGLLHKLKTVSSSSFVCSNFSNINISLEVEDVCFLEKSASDEPATSKHRAMTTVDPLLSLLNHSCSPNIIFKNVDNKGAFVVINPIMKGQQIFVSYFGDQTLTMKKAERQAHLLQSFEFHCNCIACVNDIPLFGEKKSKKHQFVGTCPTSPRSINAISSDQKDYYRFCDFINQYFHLFPCHEIDEMVNTKSFLLGLIRLPAPWLINKEMYEKS